MDSPVNILKVVKRAADEEVEQSLYAIRQKIYPRAVTGWFATWRTALVLLTQLVFYGVPWLMWNDRQAVLSSYVDERETGLDAFTVGAQTRFSALTISKIRPTNQGLLDAMQSRIWEPLTS